MNIEELQKIKDCILDIYYKGGDPIRFKELTGREDYLEQLYPEDKDKYVGDYITELFGSDSLFFDTERVKQFFSEQANRITECFFYANLNKIEGLRDDGKNKSR